jgi:hypothetical protein
MHNLFTPLLSEANVAVCELELEAGKNSILTACYRSNVLPGALAVIATIIWDSQRLLHDAALDRRMLEHFQAVLGEHFEHDLARKLRNHVRQLCTAIVNEANQSLVSKKKKLTQMELLRTLRDRRQRRKAAEKNDEDNADCGVVEEALLEELEKEFDLEEKNDPEAYQWLLKQMRVFLLSYSLLDSFLLRVRSNINDSSNDNEKNAWPLVCYSLFLLVVFHGSAFVYLFNLLFFFCFVLFLFYFYFFIYFIFIFFFIYYLFIYLFIDFIIYLTFRRLYCLSQQRRTKFSWIIVASIQNW